MSDFGRVIEVTVGPPDDAAVVEGLRCAFDVSMTSTSAPQQGTVTLYNPAPSTVARSRADGAILRVRAGYRGRATIGTVFLGQVVPGGVVLTREGPDRVLEIECADGWVTLADTYMTRTFGTDTTAAEVVQAVSEAMGIEVDVIDVPGGLRFPRGLAVQGPARDVLDDIAASTGAAWRIADGRLVFAADATAYDGQRGPLLSADAGNLIGSPALLDGDFVEVSALLQPTLRPGLGFRVQSRDVNGDYLCTEVRHIGDTFGQPFTTTATGRRL